MSRWLPVSVALLVALLIAQDAHAARGHHGPCHSQFSTTVFQNRYVRVFDRSDFDRGDRTVACIRATGKRVVLAVSSDAANEWIMHVSCVGTRLGYAFEHGERDLPDTGKACTLNVKTAKRRCAGRFPVLGMGITPAGSMAWLTYDGLDSEGGLVCCVVSKLDAAADESLNLDSGADIETDSFAVGGHRIYWTKAGQAKSAAMP